MSGVTKKVRTRWGTGRIAVSAKWPDIAADLKAAYPLTMIFERHMDPATISYSQFRRQVHRFQEIDSKALLAPVQPAIPPQPQGNADARSQSARTFSHDPEIKPSARDRILGTRKPD